MQSAATNESAARTSYRPLERHRSGPNDNPRLDVAVMQAVAQEQQKMLLECRELSVAGGCMVSVSVYGPMSEKEADEYNSNMAFNGALLGAGIALVTHFANRIPVVGPILAKSPDLLKGVGSAGSATGVAVSFALAGVVETAFPGNITVVTMGYKEHRGVRRYMGMSSRFVRPETPW